MKRSKETEPIVEEIRRLIRRSELSQRRVEERAGFSRGYLSQLLARNLDLKVWHLLAVLAVLGVNPGEFFQRLYPGQRRSALADFSAGSRPLTEDTEEALERLYGRGVGSLSALRDRLARCERAVAELAVRGKPGPGGD